MMEKSIVISLLVTLALVALVQNGSSDANLSTTVRTPRANRTLIPRRFYSPYKHYQRGFNRFLNYGKEKLATLHGDLQNEIIRSKVDVLGEVFKIHIQNLRATPSKAIELIFLVDSSSSVGAENFANELKFVKKLLADFTVSLNQTRVAVITFSSQDRVNVAVDHVSYPTAHNHKCLLLEWQMPRIRFSGGGTYTMGAMMEAQRVLSSARPDSAKAVFLITDGYSNGGDPRPAAEALKRKGAQIFTFGIRNGNVEELYDMASFPREEHSYILDSFEEFEALARRALHEDLHSDVLMNQNPQACSFMCPEGDHTCCDPNASCTCGTHTGKFMCTCRPGFYGTGLKGDCTACPPGTYRVTLGPGDDSSCLKCPDPHMSSPPGATSAHQCYCTRGYNQIGSQCQKRQCTPLEAPENGYFTNNLCSNVVNAACGVRCKPGYKLQGSSIRLCKEDGEWSGESNACVIMSCDPLSAPMNGGIECTHDDSRIDTDCFMRCDPGYHLVGSITRTCLPVAMWDGIPAHCRPVLCPPIPPLRHGTVSPYSCLSGKSRYGTECNYTCSGGFVREGPDITVCGSLGKWSTDLSDVRCEDVQPPILKCPANTTTSSLPNENYANVTWDTPYAKDNSRTPVTLTTIPVSSSPMKMAIGLHTITYQAEDSWGNVQDCQFTVEVSDDEPPRVDWCESPPTFLSGEDQVEVYWEEPIFSDNSNKPVKVSKSQEPGRFPQGSTFVQYTAEDDSGNRAYCNISITVQKHACEIPMDPINGFANCSEDSEAVFCSFTCEDGYAFAMKPQQDYFCAYDGVWRPDNTPLNFPDCSITSVSNSISQSGELAVDDDMSVCDDIFLMGQVENQLESRLEEALNALCYDDVVCEVAAVEAVCENILAELEEEKEGASSRNKRSTDYHHLWEEDGSKKWKYWYRDEDINFRSKRSLGQEFDWDLTDSFIEQKRNKRHFGLFQLSDILGFEEKNEVTEKPDAVEHDRGKYVGVFTELISKYFSDISSDQLAAFLESLKQNNASNFDSKDFISSFSQQFGERKGLELLKLVAVNSLENNGMLLAENDAEILGDLLSNKDNLGIHTRPQRLQSPLDLPMSDQPQPSDLSQHGVRIQGLQKRIQSMSRSSFKVKFELQGHGNRARESLDQAMDSLLGAANRGDFDILFGERLLRVASIRIAEDPEYLCEAGSVPQSDRCVKCPIGTFFNVIHKECQSCPQGSYQPTEGQVTCLVCPENTSTKKEFARSTNDCKAFCLPGSYSQDGLEPCTTCSMGEYQDQYSAYSCSACPLGTTTWRRGSWLLEECRPACASGHVSETTLEPCFPCPENHFQHLEGTSHCYRCPGTSWNNITGADSIEKCQGMTSEYKGSYTDMEKLDINECFSLPCMNGGTCAPLDVGHVCTCPNGYTGLQCEIDINECASEPCMNEGTCSDLLGEYRCDCRNGFSGTQCQFNIDDCVSSPCINNGTCIDGISEYRCICYPGYTGHNCDVDIDNCFGDPCLHQSTCIDLLNDFKCECAPGFTGRRCETQIDLCLESPCDHGICASRINSYICTCEPGYTGQNCDVNIDDCFSSPCMNGATCTDWINSFTCDCKPGYSGTQCQDELSTDFILNFPTSSSVNYALIEYLPQDLSEISVCFWMKSSDKENYGTPFSYATDEFDNAFTMTDYNGFVISVNGEKHITDVSANDGKWHLLCLTWSGEQNGSWKLFKDGELAESGSGLANGSVIASNGAWVLGQEQDQRAGLYNPQESFIGDIAYFNIWNTFLLPDRAKELYWLCERYVGNVKGWPDFQAVIKGSVSLRISDFCDKCGPPLNPRHGKLEFSQSEEPGPGALVKVSCDIGYKLRHGKSERKCLVTGSWSGDDPVCERLSCGYPGYLRHGRIEVKSHWYQDSLLASCDHGFRLEGNAKRTCQEDGNWSGEIPKCIPIRCSRPPPRPHQGIVSNRIISPLAQVAYSCMDGYQMDGPATQTCGRDGKLKGDRSTCQPKSCESIPEVANGNIYTEAPVAADTTVSVLCDPEHKIFGSREIKCDSNGSWQQPLPRCIPNTCPKPPAVQNGEVKVRASTAGREAAYRCDFGFVLEGMKNLICREDSTWSGPYSKCVAKPCPTPVIPEKGRLQNSKAVWRVGDSLEYACEDGFKTVGTSIIECIDNYDIEGEWEHPPPSCEVVKCQSVSNIDNGAYTIVNQPESPVQGSPSKMLQFPVGEIELSRRKKRSYDFPSIGQSSSDFPSIGQSSSDYGDYGQSLSQSSGYDYIGQSSGFDYFGQTSGGQSSVDYDMGQQSSGGNFDYFAGQTSGTEYEDFGTQHQNIIEIVTYYYGAEVEYNCSPGYKLVGSKNIVCMSDGNWDNETPRCYQQYCPAIPSLPNGHLTYHGSGMNSKVEFSCNDGYQLRGNFELMCQPDQTWSSPFPTCTLLDCGEPPKLENGTMTFTETIFNSMVTYDCFYGFVLEGSFERFCVSDGFWNGSMPRCIGITCDVPPVIQNGYITFDGSLYVDSPIEYECKECYKLNGTTTRKCQVDGTWTLTEPVCELMYCDALPDEIPNGKVIGNDPSCGSLVEFQCNPGYQLKGRSRTTCLYNQRWSSPVPTCEPVSCRSPPRLRYGRVIGNGFRFTDKVTYECNVGYVLTGPSVRVCQADTSWSDSTPQCTIKKCKKPKGPSNGRVRLSGLFYGSTANIVCDPGFRLDGDRNLKCTAEGIWDKEMPFCWPLICNPAPLIEHGSYNSTERQFESFTILKYSCDEGYYTKSADTSYYCNKDAQWEGEVITCEPKNCGEPQDLPNGNIIGSNFTYDAEISFTCDVGYNLIGSPTSKCLASGEWSVNDTTCQQIICEDPIFIPFARLVAEDARTVFGSNVNYQCEPGYVMRGAAKLTCNDKGEWSEAPPSCLPVKCPNPLEDLNSVRTGDIFEFDHVINYTCNDGYIMEGVSSLRCLETGLWSDDYPICKMITCEPPEDVPNGEYEIVQMKEIPIKTEQLNQPRGRKTKNVKSDRLVTLLTENQLREGVLYRFGDLIKYKCNVGYSMSAEGILTCTESGWSSAAPSCNIISCPIPVPIRNGDVIGDDLFYGSKLEYTCDEGYNLIGEESRTCLANKEWSDTEPFCRIVECPRPAHLEHGQTNGDSIKYKSILTYTCDPGFFLDGIGTRVCQSSGYWTGQQPECKEVFCDIPPSVPNSVQTVTDTRVGDTARYSCMEGYRMEGSAVLNCQQSGLWDKEPPMCVRVDCGPPPTGPYVVIEGTETDYDSKITYSCERGYQLREGDTDRSVCTQSGRWSSMSAPTCEETICPTPIAPTNGFLLVGDDKLKKEEAQIVPERIIKRKTVRKGRRKVRSVWSISDIESYDDLLDSEDTPDRITEDEFFHIFDQTPFQPMETVPVQTVEDIPVQIIEDIPVQTIEDIPVQTIEDIPVQTIEDIPVQIIEDIPVQIIERVPVQSSVKNPNQDNSKVTVITYQKVDNILDIFFTVDDIVKYGCDEGFYHSNDSTNSQTQCDPSGEWSLAKPAHNFCKRISCGPPPELVHANYSGNSFLYGSNYTYTCHEGYEMDDGEFSASIRCGRTGDWTGALPQCVPVSCGVFSIPQDSSVSSIEYVDELHQLSYGDTIDITCDPGFTLEGPDKLICSSEGIWSGEGESTCTEQLCEEPLTPKNMSSVFNNNDRPQTVKYSCLRGYELNGTLESTELTCRYGKWDDMKFTCTPVNCFEPEVPAHGKITARHFSFGSVANYSCEDGYVLWGNPSVTCDYQGLWIGDLPHCQAVDCGLPQTPDSGTVSTSTTWYLSDAVYQCDEGYILRGNNTRTCLSDGKWSGHVPGCYLKDCGELTPPINGFIMGSSTLYGEKMRFSCAEGYVINGENEARCEADGEWSVKVPTCKAVECQAPAGHPLTTHTAPTSPTYGSTVTYTCDEGYIARGDMTVHCNKDGLWTSLRGQCSKISCGRPVINSSGAIILGRSYYFGDRVRVKCPDTETDSYPSTSSILECTSSGSWSGSISCGTCRRKCLNGGVCLGQNKCSCKPGYYGTNCQHALCPSGCLNGGICVATNKCQCLPGYKGSRCQSPSCPSGCKGGRCIGPNVCLCAHGVVGPSCHSPFDDYSDYDSYEQTNTNDWNAMKRNMKSRG